MKGMRNLFVLGGIAFSLALPQLAFSADSPAAAPAASDNAKIDETQQHDRGFGFTPLDGRGSVAPITAPVVETPAVKKTEAKTTVKKVSVDKLAVTQHKPSKQAVITAVPKLKNSAASPADAHSSVTARATTASAQVKNSGTKGEAQTSPTFRQNENSSMLVKFSANDGGAVISARLDRNGTQPIYKVGEKMVVNVKANQDCNVVVFNFDSNNTLTQIFPNDYQQNGFVKAGEAVQIGGSDSPFDYQIAGKGGPEKIFVYAYPIGNDYNSALTAMGTRSAKVAMAPIAGTPFRGAEMTVDEYRKLVNSSQVFFSRSVEVKPRTKNTSSIASASMPASSPNKIELTFSVDNR